MKHHFERSPVSPIRFLSVLAGCVALLPNIAQADWQAVENVKPYSVAGKTGAELYASIGERGPKVGNAGRAIAFTNFKLTWTRKYEPQGNACVLTVARPKLIITYVLPKPAERLPPPIAKSWDAFISGVHQHELVHGELIKDMVKKIEAVSVGLTVADDPKCQKIRTELTARLGELSRAQRQQSRDFDQAELNSGGNIHQLVLALINGQ
jgi:predicted secreted Zn-dependent protease